MFLFSCHPFAVPCHDQAGQRRRAAALVLGGASAAHARRQNHRCRVIRFDHQAKRDRPTNRNGAPLSFQIIPPVTHTIQYSNPSWLLPLYTNKTVHNGPSKTQEQNGPFARALGHGPPSKFRRPQRHEQHKENPAQLVSSRQAAESVDTPPPRSPSCEFELKFSNLSLRPASASPLETPAP